MNKVNTKLIVGNWKMNPPTLIEAQKIARKVKRIAPLLSTTETVICPPFPYIIACSSKKELAHFHVGAQSVSVQTESGPHTGEVSASMLTDIGVEYVIVGHSEQRGRGEDNKTVSEKVHAVLGAGMTPIVCVGEVVRDDAGTYLEILKSQIKESLAGIAPKYAHKIILAYEPIWAIGAEVPMNNADIYESSLFVKKVFSDIFGPDAGLKVRVLYGGSVNYRNAPDIITLGRVNGLLVGRESVNAPGFVALLKAVDEVR
jgi:triosephosphate isomerase (TIM)